MLILLGIIQNFRVIDEKLGIYDFQAEIFAKPKIKSEIVTFVIPAQAGILVNLKQHFVFTIISEYQARFLPALE